MSSRCTVKTCIVGGNPWDLGIVGVDEGESRHSNMDYIRSQGKVNMKNVCLGESVDAAADSNSFAEGETGEVVLGDVRHLGDRI